jgi:tetratricopeptide (TPR) repeat protein
VVAVVVIWQASQIWFADHRLLSDKISEMEKGVALVPGNAEAWDRVGRYYLLNFSNPDIPRAITDFEHAVKIDPLSQNYWMDLASAYDANGNDAAAEGAYEEAHKVYPASALADWNYGNFLLREGKDDEAYEEIRLAVHGDPDLLELAISRVWHSSEDVNRLLDKVIPPDADSYITALDFFSKSHQGKPALAVWQKLMALHQPVALNRTFIFFSELFEEDDSDDALAAWNEAATAAGEPDLAVSGESLISDGYFQEAFPNGGLGWRWQSQPGATIDFDDSTPNAKGRSVRLDFNGGANVSISEPLEYVAVEPGRTYHFHAEIRTEQITTESGMRFLISDARHSGLGIQSNNLTGTTPWTSVDLDVTTLPITHYLGVELFRDPSKQFDNKLSGRVWIADMSLTPAESAASESQ